MVFGLVGNRFGSSLSTSVVGSGTLNIAQEETGESFDGRSFGGVVQRFGFGWLAHARSSLKEMGQPRACC
jgi:hypothetical protein